MFPVCIFGSRSVQKYEVIELIERHCNFLKDATHIVSGTAKGADTLGELYAEKTGLPVVPFPAPWDEIDGKPEHEVVYPEWREPYWKRAGEFRNLQMVDYLLKNGGGAIGIWDKCIKYNEKGSKGTQHMIKACKNIKPFFLYTLDNYLEDKKI